MTIGSLGYVVNDGFVRRATENDLGVYQVLCLRSIGLAIVFFVVSRLRGEQTTVAHLSRPLQLRVGAEVVASALFFAGVVRMEFANAQAVLQVAPFAVTLAAALILRERVSVLQYGTILVGFIGVLIVVRPATDGFNGWSLVVLASAGALVVRELATQRVATDIPATSIAFVTAVGLAALTAVLAVLEGWKRIGVDSLLLIALAVGSLFVGYLFTIQTVRVGDLSVSAPFRYVVLPGAVVIGLVLFDETPDAPMVIGSTVIIASGIAAIWLDRASAPRLDEKTFG